MSGLLDDRPSLAFGSLSTLLCSWVGGFKLYSQPNPRPWLATDLVCPRRWLASQLETKCQWWPWCSPDVNPEVYIDSVCSRVTKRESGTRWPWNACNVKIKPVWKDTAGVTVLLNLYRHLAFDLIGATSRPTTPVGGGETLAHRGTDPTSVVTLSATVVRWKWAPSRWWHDGERSPLWQSVRENFSCTRNFRWPKTKI